RVFRFGRSDPVRAGAALPAVRPRRGRAGDRAFAARRDRRAGADHARAACADASYRPAILIFRPAAAAARLGVWVSSVLGFVEVGEPALKAAPRFDGAISADLIGGLVSLGDRFVPVLD